MPKQHDIHLRGDLAHLDQRSCGDPCMSDGVISEASHFELPASFHAMSVTPHDVQIVIQDHCSETPLIGPEGKFCNGEPISTVLWPFQGEDMSGTFCFWVVRRRQVFFPKAAETWVSLCPQVNYFIFLCSVQTSEGWISFRGRKKFAVNLILYVLRQNPDVIIIQLKA